MLRCNAVQIPRKVWYRRCSQHNQKCGKIKAELRQSITKMLLRRHISAIFVRSSWQVSGGVADSNVLQRDANRTGNTAEHPART